MRALSRGVLALLAVLAVRTAVAAPPALAGRWALVPASPAPGEAASPPRIPATAGSGWGRDITITLDGPRLTIERHQFSENDLQPPMVYVYALDGADSRNVVNVGRGPQEQTARVEDRGETVVITTRHPPGPAAAALVTQVFSIDAAGALVIETTRTAGASTTTTKARYRRSK
jgi:hypothetical protein